MSKALITRRSLICSLLATAAMSAVTPTYGQGLPIMQGGLQGKKPQETFANLIERSLKADRTGHASIPGSTGAFARPVDVYETFHRYHPEIGPGFGNPKPTPEDLVEMTEYIRTLELVQLEESGRYNNTRIIGRGGKRRIDFDYALTLPKGTWVLADRNTGVVVLKRNCANGLRLIIDCVYINFEVKHIDEFAVIWARYNRPDDHCFKYRKTARIEEPDSPSAKWLPVPRGCIGIPCDLSGANSVVGRSAVAQGQIPLSPGTYQIRLMPDERLALCVKLKSGEGIKSSFTTIVRWREDYRLVNGQWHARVYYESKEVKSAARELGGPRGMSFWASSSEDEALIQRLAYRR